MGGSLSEPNMVPSEGGVKGILTVHGLSLFTDFRE